MRSLLEKIVLAALVAAGSSLPMAASAQTAGYPSRPVTIVSPFGPGGLGDVSARFIAQRLSQSLGQQFVVENRPGAGGVIGTASVTKAAPDGYTLLQVSSTQTVNESLVKRKPYDLMRDFTPVAALVEAPLVLVVRQDLPAKNLAEFLALAKAGKGLTYASSGTGTPYHMAGELFKNAAGIPWTHVPYKSSSSARTDMLGGQVDAMFDTVSTMADLIATGKVRALITTGAERSSILPNVPTAIEAGLPRFTASTWVGLVAPKGTPPAVVNLLNERVQQILSDPEVSAQWKRNGSSALKGSPPEFGRYLDDDIATWRKVVETSNISID